MFRFVLAAAAVLCLTVAVQAENIRGVVKSVDGKTTLKLSVGNNTERTLELAPDVRVFTTVMQGRRRRATPVLVQLNNGIANLQPNTQVLVTTETRNGKEVVTDVRLEGFVGPNVLR